VTGHGLFREPGFVIVAMKLLILFVFVLSCLGQNEKIVKTIYGNVEGTVFDNYRSFLVWLLCEQVVYQFNSNTKGIPYAAPPVGDLRWVYPRPATPWFPKTLKTTAFSAGCPQECETPPRMTV
jgi:hypothetical protein